MLLGKRSLTGALYMPRNKRYSTTAANGITPLVERLKTMLQKVKPIGECIAIAIPPNAGQGLETNLKRCMDREFALLYTMSIMLVGHRTSSVDDKSIQHWKGHASQETTTRIYIKQTDGMTEQAGKILSNFAMKA